MSIRPGTPFFFFFFFFFFFSAVGVAGAALRSAARFAQGAEAGRFEPDLPGIERSAQGGFVWLLSFLLLKKHTRYILLSLVYIGGEV